MQKEERIAGSNFGSSSEKTGIPRYYHKLGEINGTITKQTEWVKVRIGTITDDLAEKIEQALDNAGIVEYRIIGHRMIDVYTEKLK